MMVHDVELTFGQANLFNRTSVGSVNSRQWSQEPIWKHAAACVGHLSKSYIGTLEDPKISEAGRQFLGDLLVQLTDQQPHAQSRGRATTVRSTQQPHGIQGAVDGTPCTQMAIEARLFQ